MKVLELDLNHYNLFCPATGKRISGDGFYEASPAQIAMFCYEVPDAPEINEEPLQKLWEAFTEKTEDYNIDEFLKTIEGPNWLALKITNHGIACGPCSSSCAYIIDMDFCENDGD